MRDIAARFVPHETLAAALLPLVEAGDAAHDLSHILRVWRTVRIIAADEDADAEILTAATLLHDCVAVPKDAPERASASRLAARKAAGALRARGWPEARVAMAAHAIEAHSFSAGIAPQTVEACILRDADRLDAMGHVGIARCFAVAGAMGRALHDPNDPAAARRDLDDTRFALDHFRTKLLTLADSFGTRTGRAMAAERHAVLEGFFDGFLAEVARD